MKKTSLTSSIFHSLFRKKLKNESTFKHLFFLTHLWCGLLVGILLSFLCITGALFIFKDNVQDFTARNIIQREAPAKVTVSASVIAANFMEVHKDQPSSIIFPEDELKNIRITSGRGDAITAFADRETGEILGEIDPEVKSFFMTIIRLHRWYNIDKDNMHVGQFITGATTLIFLFLLISGIILWLPKFGNKKAFKNKFSLRFRYKFNIWNRDIHINLGAMLGLLFILIAWSGTFFAYNWMRTLSLNTFSSSTNDIELVSRYAKPPKPKKDRKDKKGPRNPAQKPALQVDLDSMVVQANKLFDYTGDLSVILSGPGVKSPLVRKQNTHNLLGAELYDDAIFSSKGKLTSAIRFSDRAFNDQLDAQLKALHTGSILGFKSKILYFLLCLIAAYLPISGYIMWWKRLSKRRESEATE